MLPRNATDNDIYVAATDAKSLKVSESLKVLISRLLGIVGDWLSKFMRSETDGDFDDWKLSYLDMMAMRADVIIKGDGVTRSREYMCIDDPLDEDMCNVGNLYL